MASTVVCDACINMGRDVVLCTERFISSSPHYCIAVVFPIPSSTWHQCWESRLRSLRLLASLHGVGGVSGFWEVSSRLLAGRLLPTTSGVRRSPSTVFVFFLFFLRADNVYPLSVVRFHTISVASTRSRKFDLNRSASFDSYICYTCR